MKITHNMPVNNEWENGELGASEEYVRKASTSREQAVDNALDLQVISIRLQKDLIENLKVISKGEGIGYQPLIRQVLTRYVNEILRNNKRLRAAG